MLHACSCTRVLLQDDAPSGPPVLFLSYGSSDKLINKCVYIVRACDGPVDLSIDDNSDNALLIGEAGDYRSLLESMSILVSEVCLARLEAQKAWGEAPESQVRQLIAEVASFSSSLDDSMRGMVGATVILAKPNKKIDVDALLAQAGTAKPIPVEVLKHFEGITLLLCTIITGFMSYCFAGMLSRGQGYWRRGVPASANCCKTPRQVAADHLFRSGHPFMPVSPSFLPFTCSHGTLGLLFPCSYWNACITRSEDDTQHMAPANAATVKCHRTTKAKRVSCCRVCPAVYVSFWCWQWAAVFNSCAESTGR
jgi:hypothetical protein